MKFSNRYAWLLPTLGLAGLTAGALATGGGYPGGGWTVTDQAGNPLSTNPNGGYDLRGPMTGDVKLTGAYPDVFTAAQQPNPTVGYAFIPNPNDYQGWLFSGGSTPPGGGYDPLHIWTGAQAFNQAGPTGWLGNPWNESINGSVTANTGGTLWAVFQWNGSSQPPDHIDVLLRTTVSAYVNPGPTGDGVVFPYPVTIPVSVTVSVSPSGAAGNFIAAQYGVTNIGATYSTAVPRSVPYTMSRNRYCWVEDCPMWDYGTGTMDNYEASGFQSQISWSFTKALHPGNPLQDFGERFITSDYPPAQ